MMLWWDLRVAAVDKINKGGGGGGKAPEMV